MDKTTKIILIALLVLTVFGILFNIIGVNRNLKQSLQLVKDSQTELSRAREEITKSKSQLDSLRYEMNSFGKYMKDVQERVHILDLERRINDRDFLRKKDSINIILDSLYKSRGIQDKLEEVKEFKEN